MTVIDEMEELRIKTEIRKRYRLIECRQGDQIRYRAERLIDYRFSDKETIPKWVDLPNMNLTGSIHTIIGSIHTKERLVKEIEARVEAEYNSTLPITYKVVYPYEEDLKDYKP